MEQKVVLIRNEKCKVGEVLIPREYKRVSKVISSVTLQGLEDSIERTFKTSGSCSTHTKTVELNPKDMDRISKEDVCIAYISM